MSPRVETEVHLLQHDLLVTRTAIPRQVTPTDDYRVVDTLTLAGKAAFQMMGGLRRVRADNDPRAGQVRVGTGQGARQILGRPPIDPRKEAAILADLREGKAGIIKLAAAHGLGVGTVQRIKATPNV
jgi:hypothetical protein